MDARLRYLETHSDRADVQKQIKREIQRGTIRVVPAPGGIRIIPLAEDIRDDDDLINPFEWPETHDSRKQVRELSRFSPR